MQALDTSTSSNNNQSHTLEANDKWVANLPKIHLTQAQQSVLAKGPNFAIAPNKPLNVDYILVIDSVCHKLTDQDSEGLRVDINTLLRRVQAPKPNLNKEEIKDITELRKDKDRLVLTVDRGVTMVVLDKEDYIQKAENLLAQLAYRTIESDPTNKLKAKLITTLRRIKRDTNMDEVMYKIMYPTCNLPKFYGLPKILQNWYPS